ncbi:hypothetical protein P7C73_g534, partial [Tremellales sp. Uapishka_1]
MFSTIAGTFALRWVWFTDSTASMFEHDVEQTTYLSTISISLSTLTELVSLICGSEWDKWQYVSFAFWWITVALALVTTSITYWLLIRDEEVSISNLSPTLMYPTTGLLASASAGSVLVSYTPLSVGLSMPVVIVSYLLLGAGFILSMLTLGAYFLRLLHNQTPSPKKIGAQLIPIAPFANAAYAFDSLGYLAGPKRHILQAYGKGPVADETFGQAIYASGFVLGVTIWGFATFWLLLCALAFVRDLPKTKFNLNMWSAAYPLGVYGVASTQLASDLDSPTYLENLDILPQLHSIFIHRLSLALQGGGIQRQLEVTSRSAPPIEYAPAPSIPPLPSTYSIIGKALIPQASDRSNEVLYLGWRQEDEKTVENSEWISEASLDKEEWYTFTKNAIDRTGSIILPSPPPFITFLDLDEYRAHHAELSAKAKLLMANFPPISGDDTQSEAIEEREEDSEVEEEGKSESTVRNASPIAAGNAKSFSADSGSTRSSRRRKRAKGSPSSSSSADDQHHRKRIDDRGERYPSEVP